jgi:hypothetical protein
VEPLQAPERRLPYGSLIFIVILSFSLFSFFPWFCLDPSYFCAFQGNPTLQLESARVGVASLRGPVLESPGDRNHLLSYGKRFLWAGAAGADEDRHIEVLLTSGRGDVSDLAIRTGVGPQRIAGSLSL